MYVSIFYFEQMPQFKNIARLFLWYVFVCFIFQIPMPATTTRGNKPGKPVLLKIEKREKNNWMKNIFTISLSECKRVLSAFFSTALRTVFAFILQYVQVFVHSAMTLSTHLKGVKLQR